MVFFWSNEGNEPIHVHIAKGQPAANSTKVWLLEKGGCILEHNKSKIPRHDLDVIMDIIIDERIMTNYDFDETALSKTIDFTAFLK